MKQMKALLFDLDQTLVDSSLAESFRNLRQWNRVYPLIGEFTLYEGMTEVFDSIRSGKIPTAIITNSPGAYASKVIATFGIPCDCLIDFHSVKNRKPHPEPFLKALGELGVEAESAISFGDRKIDILASQAASVKSAACLWGTNEKDLLHSSSPSFILSHPLQILNLI